MWLHGVWLGLRPESGEVLVGTPVGVFKARSIKRKPFENRWGAQQIKSISGTPWKPTPNVIDYHIRIGPPVEREQRIHTADPSIRRRVHRTTPFQT